MRESLELSKGDLKNVYYVKLTQVRVKFDPHFAKTQPSFENYFHLITTNPDESTTHSITQASTVVANLPLVV